VDRQVVNSIPYYYAVSAFDVNSLTSGPASLESSVTAMSVVPVAPAANTTSVAAQVGLYGRGVKLNTDATMSISPATGRFAGPSPPTDGLSASLDIFAATAIAPATFSLTIDSVIPSYYDGEYYLTQDYNGQTTEIYITHPPNTEAGPIERQYLQSLEADSAKAESLGQQGLPFAGLAAINFRIVGNTWYSGDAEWHDDVDGAFWSTEGQHWEGGSRWFSGDNETRNDPTLNFGRGELPGVDSILTPQPNWSGGIRGNVYALFRRLRQSTWHAARAADINFYWGAAGTLDSVIDITHNLPVEFHSSEWVGQGWGFRTDITGIGTTQSAPDGVVTEYDFAMGPCFSPFNGGLPSHSAPDCASQPYEQTATLSPVDVDGDGVADGDGFALYFNHEFYIFQMETLPENVVWTHRSYYGDVTYSGGQWAFDPKPMSTSVRGLQALVQVDSAAAVREVTEDDLANVHPVPDPYYATNSYERTPANKVIKFVNLPQQAIIRIYSLSGVLVDVIEHNDPTLGGEAEWNVRNRNDQFVASGVYFYHVETANGLEKIGRMTIVNSGSIVIFEQ
jgi:hypothetical protein